MVFFTAWYNKDLNEAFRPIMNIRKKLNLEQVKKSDEILLLKDSNFPSIFSTDDLKEIWQVAEVKIIEEIPDSAEKMIKTEENFQIWVTKSEKKLCPRCRLHTSLSSDELCERCDMVIKNFK